MGAYLSTPVSFGYRASLRIGQPSRGVVLTLAVVALAVLAIAGVATTLLLPHASAAPPNTQFLTP
jgi:hypothetical protein